MSPVLERLVTMGDVSIVRDDQLGPGPAWRDAVADQIARSDAVVVWLTDKPSSYVAAEAGMAAAFRKPILTVRLDGGPIPFDLGRIVAIDGVNLSAQEMAQRLHAHIGEIAEQPAE